LPWIGTCFQDPAFVWWAPHYLATTHRIGSATKARYKKVNQKFGVAIPKTVEEALQIDADTSTTYWTDAIEKEMHNNQPRLNYYRTMNKYQRDTHSYNVA
jgi:hypothetical protein